MPKGGWAMYYAVVILLMAVFPVLSMLWDQSTGTPIVEAALKWFVFWPVGLRLGLAGRIDQPFPGPGG